ncbi:SDR family oxidoreductase [Hoyosella subflava]|uniref:Short-chain dehydrogenase/reductase SDR n=1 Tax=Hoyosella subflava (strain DSM 45089 / JCM 17490 / NBRC 109087 / DQS3-9A1) TaxID=443218 RepID=F6EER8_HOYSD|nr:SDR family oxidoreductase [Hoyosella subflava]AEF40868.1 Short-chain dehydrogenase/reductase SDR [Hoyosella subflava DQS3-9A1]
MNSRSLSGRVALITGVSRRQGIGYAVARRLAALGAGLYLTHWVPHDAAQPWGADDIDALLGGLPGAPQVVDRSVDFANPDAPQQVMDEAVRNFGHVDILVANHARSGNDGSLFDIDADMLDGHWAVDARSVLLLTQAFARQFCPGRSEITDRGRVIWMTSGQHLGPMRDEVAYGSAKSVLAGMTQTVASELIERGIILNTVNPGPVDTGYLTAATTDRDVSLVAEVHAAFPRGKVGTPDDPARLIAWLATDEGRWVVGQVINSEGGFRRSK